MASEAPDLEAVKAEILRVLRSLLVGMEQAPAPYLAMDEPTLRLTLLNPLNAIGPSGATAEAYNGRGKVDILMRHGSSSLLLAECKLYDGPNSIVEAIEQLLRYATWRDRDLCLIVFVRSPAMTAAAAGLREAAERSPLVDHYEDIDGHGSEVLLHGHRPDDPDFKLSIRCLLVHLRIPDGTSSQLKLPRGTLTVADTAKVLHELKRAQPENMGVEYTPTLDPDKPDLPPGSGWAVTYSHDDGSGNPVGIRARPTDEHGRRHQSPQGRLVPADEAKAKALDEAIRRAHKDNVAFELSGVGVRFGRIAAGLRGPADRTERADPKNLLLKYGPRGLYQCVITVTSAESGLAVPMAFAVQEPPKPGREMTLAASLYDLTLTISFSRDRDDTEIAWNLGPRQGTAGEHLASQRLFAALSTPGVMRIDSIEPDYGTKSYELQGAGPDQRTLFDLWFWTLVAAVEEHTGTELPIPEEFDGDWLTDLNTVGSILLTGTVSLTPGPGRVVCRLADGAQPAAVGDVQTLVHREAISHTVGEMEVNLGQAHYSVEVKITAVGTLPDGHVAYEVEPLSQEPVDGILDTDPSTAGEAPQPEPDESLEPPSST